MDFVILRGTEFVSYREIVELKLAVAHAEVIQRKNLRKKCPPNPVAPLNQCRRQVVDSVGVAELAGLNDRTDLFVGEGHDLFSGPIVVVGNTA